MDGSRRHPIEETCFKIDVVGQKRRFSAIARLHGHNQLDLRLELVDLVVQARDFRLALQVDLVVEGRREPILRRLPVLAHHDDGCLQGRQHRQEQVEKHEGIRIERVLGQDRRVEQRPRDEEDSEADDKPP
jgi:hypothetical protein